MSGEGDLSAHIGKSSMGEIKGGGRGAILALVGDLLQGEARHGLRRRENPTTIGSTWDAESERSRTRKTLRVGIRSINVFINTPLGDVLFKYTSVANLELLVINILSKL